MADQQEHEQPQGGETPQDTETVTFDNWIAEQPDDVRALYEAHTNGLRSALKAERETAKQFRKELDQAIKASSKDSDARAALTQMQRQLAARDAQLAAYDALSGAGASNLKLAYLAASSDGLIGDDGTLQLDTLRETYPELFGAKAPAGNAGNGTQTPGSGHSPTMDDVIRNYIRGNR